MFVIIFYILQQRQRKLKILKNFNVSEMFLSHRLYKPEQNNNLTKKILNFSHI